MRFKDFLLKEEKERHAVLAFGRMNPPTTGHEVLVNKVKEVANKYKASHHVVLSHSQDKNKNPLTAVQKVRHARRFFPGTNVTVATKDEPNFLTQAAKLHKKGVTHLHMVAGSDRVPEYHKLLHKYNGTHEGALFNFKHIEVHSAGERDPDAEGTTGMSASKMRAHAAAGNFKEFKKGIPSHVPEHHAKELYDHVRKGMGVREHLEVNIPMDELFEQFITEGVHDKGIFKAVFLSGGPGSGKDYVLDNTLQGHGLTEINSDKALEYLMDKNNLDMTMPESEKDARDLVRGKAKSMTELRQRLALFGRNGLIINGTGDDVEKIKKIKERLEQLGYETSMVSVVTDDEVSRQRNIERGQRGGRTVPEEIRKKKWDAVTEARPELAKLFGQNYVEFDNSQDLRNAPPEVVKQKQEEMLDIFKGVKEFVSKPPQSEMSQAWIANELGKKDTLGVPKQGVKQTAPKSHAEEGGVGAEAQKLGLQYYGFGRYGKDGKVTHHSVHGKLVQDPQKVQGTPDVPVSSSSGSGTRTATIPPKEKEKLGKLLAGAKEKLPGAKKTVKEDINDDFENFLTEAVTISITADTPEEAARTVQLLKSEPEEVEKEDSNNPPILSDDSARHLLQLTKMDVEEYVLPEPTAGIPIEETKKVRYTYLKDGNGKDRVFMLRAAAAKEAHQKNGEVEKFEKGYRVKLKENVNVTEINQLVEEPVQRRGLIAESTGSNCQCGTSEGSCGCEEGRQAKGKKTLLQAKSKLKQSINEIDQGTEVGMSMSGGGENATRGGLSTRAKKKPFDENIGDGGEMATSMSDKKEDDLKKTGIALSTFRGRNYQ